MAYMCEGQRSFNEPRKNVNDCVLAVLSFQTNNNSCLVHFLSSLVLLPCDSFSHCSLYRLACLHAIYVSLYVWYYIVLREKNPVTH